MDDQISRLVAFRYIVAMDFSSPEALKEYLREHPNADPRKHHVKKDKGNGEAEHHSGLTSVKVKMDKSLSDDIKKVWKGGPSGNAVDSLAKAISEGREVNMNAVHKAMLVLKNEASNPSTSKEKVKELKELAKKLKEHSRKGS